MTGTGFGASCWGGAVLPVWRPIDPEAAASSVFKVLGRHVTEGEIGQVRDMLPRDVRRLWPDDDAA